MMPTQLNRSIDKSSPRIGIAQPIALRPARPADLEAEIIDAQPIASGHRSIRNTTVRLSQGTYNSLIANRIGWICSLVLISGIVLCGFTLSLACAIATVQRSTAPVHSP